MYVSVLGDSLSTFRGCNPEGYLVYYDDNNAMMNGLSGKEDTWWHKVINMLGGELLVNASYSGSKVSGLKFPSANVYERVSALKTDIIPDTIIIHLGHNDYGFGIEIGSDNDDVSCFYPACKTMLRHIKELYPDTRIICSTLMKTYIMYRPDWHLPERNKNGIEFEKYNNAIRKASAELEVELADICATGIEYDTLDGSHGTDRGHREIAEAWKIALAL